MDAYVNESFECLNKKPDAIDAMNEFMIVWKRLSDSKGIKFYFGYCNM